MSNLEKHIENLKKYINEDFTFREPIKNMSDFDKYCWNHCKDIEAVIKELENAQSDLHEANNRINDLLDLDTQKDKLIDEIILYIIRHNYFDTTEFDKNIVPTIENIKKYFEERCK